MDAFSSPWDPWAGAQISQGSRAGMTYTPSTTIPEGGHMPALPFIMAIASVAVTAVLFLAAPKK